MKATVKLFLSIMLLGILTLCNCTDKRWFYKITYEGIVMDTIGGVSVPGVKVILIACKPEDGGLSDCNYFEVGHSTTDSNGHFKIDAKEARCDRYAIQAGNTYYPKDHRLELSKNDLKSSQYTTLYLK